MYQVSKDFRRFSCYEQINLCQQENSQNLTTYPLEKNYDYCKTRNLIKNYDYRNNFKKRSRQGLR